MNKKMRRLRTVYNYRCNVCGCCLDPGEGNLCDECQKAVDARRRNAHQQYYVNRKCKEKAPTVAGITVGAKLITHKL